MSSNFYASDQARLARTSALVEGQDDRPLTEAERALLVRLLSDPFAYPQVFKTWLVNFIETSDLLLPRSAVEGLSLLLGSGGGQGVMGLLPAGIVFPFGGSAAPSGTLLCNGAAYLRTGYSRLFNAIGTAYGAGDGSTTFNVPDLRRRVPWGFGVSTSMGQSDGLAEAVRSISHHHHLGPNTLGGTTDIQGLHHHGAEGDWFFVTSPELRPIGTQPTTRFMGQLSQQHTAEDGAHGHNVTVNIDQNSTGDTGNRDNPAYQVVNFIVNF